VVFDWQGDAQMIAAYLLDTLIGIISLCLLMAAIVYPIYVLLGVLERRQRRNRYLTRIPPKGGFRDDNGKVRMRSHS
jgi:hypothetical protein